VGEPPLMLGIAVWAAVKNALAYLAPGMHVDLQLPATGEEILRCLTQLTADCIQKMAATTGVNEVDGRCVIGRPCGRR
jgi:xanthine dehydrogenase molybdopterin-binding subunit B